jgi:hypothetical protein
VLQRHHLPLLRQLHHGGRVHQAVAKLQIQVDVGASRGWGGGDLDR